MTDDRGLNQRREFNKPYTKIGIGRVVERLIADNYDVVGLSFNPEGTEKSPKIVFAKEGEDKKKSIPADCHTLIVAGQSRPLPTEIIDAIQRYMDRNGRMLVFLGVVTDEKFTKLQNTGLEPMLHGMSVEVPDEFVMRFAEQQAVALLNRASPPLDSENPLARAFLERSLFLNDSARVVKPVAAAHGGGRFKAETFLEIDSDPVRAPVMVERDAGLLDLERVVPYLKGLKADPLLRTMKASKTPIPVAVTVSEGDKTPKPRMVVFGNTEFITNFDLATSRDSHNYAILVSSLEWLAERESMGIGPKERTFVRLNPDVDYGRMVMAPFWVMLLTFIGLGGGFWLVRRR
jgi:hypothetical protein